MAWWIPAAIGAGVGALKYGQDKKDAQARRESNANLMRYSGWTGLKPAETYVPEPSLLGNIASGALTGASFGLMNWGDDGNRLNPMTGEPVTTDPVTKTDNSSVGGSGVVAASAADAPKVDASSMSLYQQDRLASGGDPPLADLYRQKPSYPYGVEQPLGEYPLNKEPLSPWMYMNSQGQIPARMNPPRIGPNTSAQRI